MGSMTLYSGRGARVLSKRCMNALLAAAILLTPALCTPGCAETKKVPAAHAASVAADGMTAADAKDPKLGQDWVRLDYDANGEVQGMQTAVVRYTSKATAGNESPVQVDLIGAVHIADPAHYEKLNERFKHYDVLLYELVAPEGTVVEKGRGTSNAHPIGAMQNVFKDMLELDHQL